MDASSTAAAWLSFLVTGIGLGSLITQANAISEQMDPFRTSRSRETLGSWISRQPRGNWYQLAKPKPVGPVIAARLTSGLCGVNNISLSRLPLGAHGNASWTTVLALYHREKPTKNPEDYERQRSYTTHMANEGFVVEIDQEIDPTSNQRYLPWLNLPTQDLTLHNSSTCITVNRATLMTLLSLCSAHEIFRYSDASGHRAAYSSYCGLWYIEWPLRGAAMVKFAPHDSHSIATDVYPRTFSRRVDKCIRMTAGVITDPDGSFQCAFPGRKPPGRYILEYQHKGFPGAHASRHLYNMMGGKVYEVDFLLARPIEDDKIDGSGLELLHLPSLEKNVPASILVPEMEAKVLAHALDCLPWDSLSWSIHRGLRDILTTYAKPTMNLYRKTLACTLRMQVSREADRLEMKGWDRSFVQTSMADLAANSILAGAGNSGDSVRIVTDIVSLLWTGIDDTKDETRFWREGRYRMGPGTDQLSDDAIVALTKFFILEWSYEFDYHMFNDWPVQLLFG